MANENTQTPKGLTKDGAGLKENNFSAPDNRKANAPEDILSIYDPSVDAFRDVPREQAERMIENAESVKKQLQRGPKARPAEAEGEEEE